MIIYNDTTSVLSDILRMRVRLSAFPFISTSPFLPFIVDGKQFFLMHHKLLIQPTPWKSHIALSIATVGIDNDETDEQVIVIVKMEKIN